MKEARKIPKLSLGVTLLMLWWTVAVFIEDGPFNNYRTRLSSFEATYGVDSSDIAGCWGDQGGEWVNTCASRADDAGWAWITPLFIFLFSALYTAYKYVGSAEQAKSPKEDESDDSSTAT